MSPLIDALLRISAILAAGLLARALVRRHSPTLRHLVLATAIVAAPAVVPLGSILPAITIVLPHREAIAAARRDQPSSDASSQQSRDAGHPGMPPAADATGAPGRLDATGLALGAWIAGAIAGLLILASRLWRLARLTSRARLVAGTWAEATWTDALDTLRAAGLASPAVTVRVGPEPALLATWGWRRPVVLIPEAALSWPADRVQLVLRHELAHVARADWLVQLYADALRALLWWNPLPWMACRHLRQDSELACDDAVLASGVEPHAYADLLVSIARACRPAPANAAMPMAHPSTLHRRIVTMLDSRLDRTPPTRRVTFAAIAALVLAIVIPAAVLRAAQGPQPLEGVIYDPSGAVLPGVAVTLASGPARQEATTDPAGRFRFENVAPGTYTLETGLPGFKKLHEPVTLKADADWNRAVTMQIGDLQESIAVRQRRVAPQQPAGTAGPTPVRVGGNIRVPVKIAHTSPVYPPSMLEAGREGNVPLEATIDVEGNVSMVRVASAQVHPDFAAAAIEAVRKWRYRPTLLNGKPVAVVMTVNIAFSLE